MIAHYLKVALRSLMKYKMQTAVSIVGLAVGFVCFAFSMIWIRYELTYDSFHPGAERIYIVYGESKLEMSGYSTHNVFPLANAIHRDFPEVESAASFYNWEALVELDGRIEKLDRIEVDTAFIRMFGVRLLGGNWNFLRSPDEIAITLGLSEYSKLEHIVAVCEKSGVHTKFIPDYNNIIPTRPYTEDLMGLPVINIRHVPLTNTFNAFLKRSMDLAGSVCAIILFSPVMLLTAVAVKMTSPGPLIYTQERVGLHNKTFRMYKFRSMDVQSPKKERGAWTVPDDPRVTKVGKIIRKTSIDELPQLFNILKGDMSLVGPRPERPFFVEKFREEIPRYMIKHQVRPGMTGWAQINGYRGNTSIRKRIEYDLYYIENWTLGFDIKILFLTIFKGFINKNAY